MSFANDEKNRLLNLILNADREKSVKDPKTDFTRRRSMPFEKVISTILGFGRNSLTNELVGAGDAVSESAFCQARDKIKTQFFMELFYDYTRNISVQNLYRGKRIFAIDGTDIPLVPNIDSKYYRDQGRRNGEPTKPFGMIHINFISDVLNKQFLDLEEGKDERGAAIRMIDRFKYNGILTADMGYSGYNLLGHLMRNPHIDFCFRFPNTSAFSVINDLPLKELDEDMEVTLSFKPAPYCKKHGYVRVFPTEGKGKYHKGASWDFEDGYTLRFRVVRFQLSTGEYETLVTSLSRTEFPIYAMKELYHLRWQIEVNFRHLKYDMGMLYMHSRKDEFILQEVIARALMFNYCMAIAMQIKVVNPSRNKHTYKINLSVAFFTCMIYFRHSGNDPPFDKDIEDIIRSKRVIYKPGRHDPRKNKKQVWYVCFSYRGAA